MEEYAISLLLISFSALFSGLTLGYFTLNTQNLERQARLGNIAAQKILPIRRKGNQLLTTLLLGNVAVNAVLSIYLSSLASGVIAAFIATTLIFLFGEIIPQAVISRHAVYFGSKLAFFVRGLMIITYPVAYPVAYILDKLLGAEIHAVYSKDELREIISEHEDSEHSDIDEDEERIMHGALLFSHTKVVDVMTPADKVVMFELHQRLSDVMLTEINDHGYSRFPVYRGDRSNVVGLLFAKDLIVENDDILIKDADEAFESAYLKARTFETLDAVLSRMLKQKRHLAIVFNKLNIYAGVISLEDIIEEIIQFEIEDEDDD